MSDRTTRLDQAETLFFERQLDFVKSQTYDTKYKELRGLNAGLLPINSEGGSAVATFVWRSFTEVAQAKIIADYGHDIPRVDIYGVENTVSPKLFALSYSYTLFEIRRAAKAGFALETRKAMAVRRGIDTSINTVALVGDSDNNLQGLINYTGVPSYTIPADGSENGGSSSKLWIHKTPDEILRDLNGILNAVQEATNGVENADTILLPLAKYNYIKDTRLGSVSDKTILQFFLENNPGVRVDWLTELKNAGSGGTIDKMIAYTNNPMSLELFLPNPFEQLEQEYRNLEWIVPCIAECAGVVFYYPYSACYAEGF